MLFKIFWALRAILYRPFFKRIGFPSYIGKPIFLSGTRRISIGSRVRIFPNVRMEAVGKGRIIIEDNCAIGQDFHVTAGGELVIKTGCTISGNVFITDIDHEYREIDVHIMNQTMLISETVIGENCFIGFGARIQAGTRLGRQCIVGTNAVVRGIFPDYSVIAGVPARIIKRYNPKTGNWDKVKGKK
jgi:acetyltransferase-like isoleucine patch superfamily enzyme